MPSWMLEKTPVRKRSVFRRTSSALFRLDGHGGLGGDVRQDVHVLSPVADALRVCLDDHGADRPALGLQRDAQPIDRGRADGLHLSRLLELEEFGRVGQQGLASAEDVVRETPPQGLRPGGGIELVDEIGEAEHSGLVVVHRDVEIAGRHQAADDLVDGTEQLAEAFGRLSDLRDPVDGGADVLRPLPRGDVPEAPDAADDPRLDPLGQGRPFEDPAVLELEDIGAFL